MWDGMFLFHVSTNLQTTHDAREDEHEYFDAMSHRMA